MSSGRFADYGAVAAYLFGLKGAGVKFGVERMAALSQELGYPERRYPVVHVAGTNGKGSVSAMVERILREAGLRTGLYTSPHLVRLGERVQVDRRELTEAEIVAFVEELGPAAARVGKRGDDFHPSFFEFMTAMAFLQFARSRVDVAVVEVGMGGRLDATNVVAPEVAVITSIGFDHMEYLGDTLAKIAAEKAGIVKPGRPLVMGRVPPEAEAVIRATAEARGAPLVSVREAFGYDLAAYPRTSLEGDYQRWNAATALLVARALRPRFARLDDALVARALADVHWPGRWQRTQLEGRELILDASHNSEGAEVLEANLRRLVARTGRAPVVVTGVLGEYRARALLAVLARHAREIHLVPPLQARACTHAELEALTPPAARALLRRTSLESVFPGPGRCGVGQPGDVVVVTGSIYLLGEVLTRLGGAGGGEGRLQDF